MPSKIPKLRPNDTAGSIGSDQVARLKFIFIAFRIVHREYNAIGVLAHADGTQAIEEFDAGCRSETVAQHTRQFPLLALQPIRKGRLAGQGRQVECCDCALA